MPVHPTPYTPVLMGFVDADDFVHPDMYEVLMKEACKNGLDAVYCEYEKVDETATAKNVFPYYILEQLHLMTNFPFHRILSY